MEDGAFKAQDLARKVDDLISLCTRLREENEKLRADNARLRTKAHGTSVNQRSAYRDVKNLIVKVRNLEEKV